MIPDKQTSTLCKPVTELIQERFSCRAYLDQPIAPEVRRQLEEYAALLRVGPLGTPLRFHLLASTEDHQYALRGLGTYGTIRSPAGFLVGAVCPGVRDLEDFGYMLEKWILFTTGLGLGTCWLGGSFTRTSFAHRISARHDELMPAVVSVGYIPDVQAARAGSIRRMVNADQRLPWETLFFDGRFDAPLRQEDARPYAVPLEMVRLAPSAHNKQPWRVVRDGNAWHFYIHRGPALKVQLVSVLLKIVDLPRLDLGIAMSHFELAARELGLDGRWINQQPGIEKPDRSLEYCVTWLAGG